MERDIYSNNNRVKALVVNTLMHYASFSLPLKADEIYKNIPVECGFSDLLVVLEDLTATHKIFMYKGYYSATTGIEQMVRQRIVSYN